MIVILDYGSQYTQLIARRVRELQTYCQIVPFDADLRQFESEVKGFILSGGPASVYEQMSPTLPQAVLTAGVPVLGICYGAQLLVHALGGAVVAAKEREFGQAEINLTSDDALWTNMAKPGPYRVWMSHGDRIEKLPDSLLPLAQSAHSPFAGFRHSTHPWFGLQFHPEVTHTEPGQLILQNFVEHICHCPADWTMDNFIEQQTHHIAKLVGDRHVLCAVSGGVDSSVVALLLHRILGAQLTAVFVDHGLLRQSERDVVEHALRDAFAMDLRVIDASDLFLKRLAGVTDPEHKRKIIGKTFIEVFEQQAQNLNNVAFLAQGTLYPDVIESVSQRGPAATIKSHHNVGGLPDKMKLKLIEPLRELFKDEVRELGKTLGLPQDLLQRHPFPGPGLAVRILDAVTAERVAILQQADAIFIEELHRHQLYHQVWQAFAVLLPVQTVGVMGDQRTYENVCALRAVTSLDGMTAEAAALPHEFLHLCANRIINQVKGINRVVYDISSKPPATIEWE